MQVSHVEKNMLEQSSTVPNSLKEYLNHTLGLIDPWTSYHLKIVLSNLF